ncbi:hypothetical protein KCU93_g6882, partial [Aureobasidium melanogenum]
MITMDEETAKEIQSLQDQIASLLTRKIQREDVSMEDDIKHLKQRLTNSIKRCQDANLRSTQLSKKNEQLENENQLLEKSTKDQARSIRTQDFEIDELEQENRALKAKLERLEKHEAASKNAIAALREKLDLVLEAVSKIDDNPTSYRNAASAALDEETEEFVRDVLNQATSFVLRKRKREDEEVQAEIQGLEHEIKVLKDNNADLETRLTKSLGSCQETNMRKAEAVEKSTELQADKDLLEKKAEEQAHTIKSLETAAGTWEEENKNLKVELERLRKYEVLWNETSTKFNTISYLHTSPPIMVTPADMIRELTLNNKLLVKKNEALKVENHNLKVTNDMLKNKAATDQAIMNAAVTIKNLEAYNQTLENENQHLREQLEHCAEKKKIDEELEVLRKEVEAIDEELAKRMAEMDLMQELGEKMKLLKQIDAQEDGQKENESDSDDVFKEHTKEDSK